MAWTALHRCLRKVRQEHRRRRFLPRFRVWLRDGLHADGDHWLLLSAFTNSSGADLQLASREVQSAYRPVDFGVAAGPVGLTPGSGEFASALDALRSEGYVALPWQLEHSLCMALSRYLQVAEARIVSDNADVNGLTAKVDLDNPVAEKYDIPIAWLTASPEIRELMLDPGVLAFAQDYLGAPPIVDICASWFSFPVRRASVEAATMFHFDLDRVKWLKVFYYLNDVHLNNGAHMFVPRSHRDGAIPRELLARGYTRLADEEVEAHFPRESWKAIEGPIGTILFEDTRGLHKGIPLVEGHRLVLQFQYSVDLFGAPSSLAGAWTQEDDPRWTDPKYQRVLSAFR